MSLDDQEFQFLLSSSFHVLTEEEELSNQENCPETYYAKRSGWVYVLKNPLFPDLVKIGCTKHHPAIRCRELSSPTCCPAPFQVIYARRFQDRFVAEKSIHHIFKENRVGNKEFFKGLSASAISRAFEMARQDEWLTEDMKQ